MFRRLILLSSPHKVNNLNTTNFHEEWHLYICKLYKNKQKLLWTKTAIFSFKTISIKGSRSTFLLDTQFSLTLSSPFSSATIKHAKEKRLMGIGMHCHSWAFFGVGGLLCHATPKFKKVFIIKLLQCIFWNTDLKCYFLNLKIYLNNSLNSISKTSKAGIFNGR